jgi:hypothetical protein
MWKRCVLFVFATLLVVLLAAPAHAVEIKNFRSCYAPIPVGATRTEAKCLPGDFIWFTFDFEGLKTDPKTGKVNYEWIFELFDAQATRLVDKRTPSSTIPQLGGSRMPGDLQLEMGRNQKPGKYTARLTVIDRLSNEQKSHIYQFELLSKNFGIAGVIAPALGFCGQHYATDFVLIDSALDDKKQPNVEVTMRVLDDSGKPVATPIVAVYPRDLPAEISLEKENLIPVRYPLFLNRSGRFTVDILAKDIAGKKEARLSYPLTVLEVGAK